MVNVNRYGGVCNVKTLIKEFTTFGMGCYADAMIKSNMRETEEKATLIVKYVIDG